MATPAQITANQANAQHSTGPRSAEGKARSALNHLNHGFRSQSVLLPGDDPAEYEALLEELAAHFSTRDLSEQRMVREMADAEWRLRRTRNYQQAILTRKIEELAPLHPGTDPITLQALAFDALLNESSSFAQFLRYETKYERQYNTAYNQWCFYQQGKDRHLHHAVETSFKASFGERPPAPPTRRLPNEPNLPDEPNSAPETARNAACPCGSGQKYKRCCGKNAPPLIQAA